MLHINLTLLPINRVRDILHLEDVFRHMSGRVPFSNGAADAFLQVRCEPLARPHLDEEEDALVVVGFALLAYADAVGEFGEGFGYGVDFSGAEADA